MNIAWSALPFENLTLAQLYAILRLREEVFVVEQITDIGHLYPECDGWDERRCT